MIQINPKPTPDQSIFSAFAFIFTNVGRMKKGVCYEECKHQYFIT